MGAALQKLVGPPVVGTDTTPLPPLARLLPLAISLRLPVYMPVWRHRSVSRAWHRAVLAACFERVFGTEGVVTSTEMLHISRGYFEGDLDYVARRLDLARPARGGLEFEFSPTGEETTLVEGVATVRHLRGGSAYDAPEEVAKATGKYSCVILPGERVRVIVRTVRTFGVSEGSSDDFDLSAALALFHKV